MIGLLATDRLQRTSPRRIPFPRKGGCSTPRASPRLPEGAGRSLDRSSAASGVPCRLADATRSVPTPCQRRCYSQPLETSRRLPPPRCLRDCSFVSTWPEELLAGLGLGTRPRCTPGRLSSYPIHPSSRALLVVSAHRAETRWVVL